MNEETIVKVVGELYLKNIALQQQIKELLAEQQKLRELVGMLQSGKSE